MAPESVLQENPPPQGSKGRSASRTDPPPILRQNCRLENWICSSSFFGGSCKIGFVGARSVAPIARSVVLISRFADLERIGCGSVEVRVCIHYGSRADLRESGRFCGAFFVFGNFELFCEELHFSNTPKVPLDAP